MEYIGIDIGGSHITTILTDHSFNVKEKSTVPVSQRDLQSVLDTIYESVSNVINLATNLKAVGIAVPGNVDPSTNCARYLPNFTWEPNVPLGELIKQRLSLSSDIDIYMRNDGRCAAIAESKFGAGKNSKVFSFLTLGTGIGGALVINGTLFDGFTYDAGDFGHHVICNGSVDAFPCACGKRGCFETQASAEGLVRHYKALQSKYNTTNSTNNNTINTLISLNAEQVIQMKRNQDPQAIEAFHNYINDLSTGLANLVTFYNPDIIALGGGLSQAPELFETLSELVHEKTLPATRGIVKIIPSSVGVDAGAIGAAILASTCHEQSLLSLSLS